MPDSYWRGPLAFVIFGVALAAISALLIWDSSAILTEQRVRYDEAARSYADQAADRIERNCGANLGPSILRDCIRQEIEAAEDSKRAERDLDAQEAMARFTRVMGYTAIIGLVLGLGSIYLIWATLRETQRMAGITRDIGVSQVRAYLSVIAAEIVESPNDPDLLMCRIRVKNSGNSPARKISVTLATELWSSSGNTVKPGSRLRHVRKREPLTDIGAGESRWFFGPDFKGKYPGWHARTDTYQLAILGEVQYRHVFHSKQASPSKAPFTFAVENFTPVAQEISETWVVPKDHDL